MRPENVCIADISEAALERARAHGHRTALLTQDGRVPFPDGFFDVVFCSSVIEHVTIPKKEVRHGDQHLARRAVAHQRAFTDEILRISKSYLGTETPTRHPPDYLLTRGHMEASFPGARIEGERWLGMTKSWIAVQHR